MGIYAEYLFIENFITGLFILHITAKICGRKIKKSRLIIGASLCGIYAFVLLFESMAYWLTILHKIAFSTILVIIAFELFPVKKVYIMGRIKAGLKILLTFYIVSFVMGGITIAWLYIGGIKGITNNGTIYMENVTYITVAIGVAITYIIGSAFAEFIKERTSAEKIYRDVIVEIGDEKWTLKAMIDTGNFLKEPATGKAVAIICKSAADEILKNWEKNEERISLIPYKSIGAKRGILVGFRVDRVIADENVIENMVLAVYDGEFSSGQKGEEYRMLLHRELLKGGIAVNV